MSINKKINEIALKYFDGNNVKFADFMQTSEANIRNYRKKVVPKLDFIIMLRKKLEISYEYVLGDVETNSEAFAEPKSIYHTKKDIEINELKEKINVLQSKIIDLQDRLISPKDKSPTSPPDNTHVSSRTVPRELSTKST
ncbi:MerR family transcriptional regulator [Pedobacter arcticus]|uniref:hypothetical protein n=1 Tax=Pedobacter arcticus TaxID=752140 RepID=UPI0002D8DF05|nr:hypothetical protein [Pedobacter arcticus]